MTLGEMLTRARRFGIGDERSDPDLIDAFNDAKLEVEGSAVTPQRQNPLPETITVPSGAQAVALPNTVNKRLDKVEALFIGQSKLGNLSNQDYFNRYAGGGPQALPTHYTLRGGSMLLWPIPDATYQALLFYIRQPEKFANINDSPSLPEKYHEVVFYNGLARLLQELDNTPEEAQDAAGRADAALQTMVADLQNVEMDSSDSIGSGTLEYVWQEARAAGFEFGNRLLTTITNGVVADMAGRYDWPQFFRRAKITVAAGEDRALLPTGIKTLLLVRDDKGLTVEAGNLRSDESTYEVYDVVGSQINFSTTYPQARTLDVWYSSRPDLLSAPGDQLPFPASAWLTIVHGVLAECARRQPTENFVSRADRLSKDYEDGIDRLREDLLVTHRNSEEMLTDLWHC